MARPLAWGFTNIAQPLTSTLRVSSDLLLDLTSSDTITVTRIIGHLQLFNELGQHLIGIQGVDFGIGVASVEAFAVAGSAAIPDPSVSAEIPPRGWLWSDRMSMYMDEGQTDADFMWTYPEVRFDVRASRKVDRGICYLTMHSANLFGVAQTVNVVGCLGVLCMT